VKYLRRRGPAVRQYPRCECGPGLFRFEYPRPLSVGTYCPACLLVTLRDEAEVEQFLNLYEDDVAMRAAVVGSLQQQFNVAAMLEQLVARHRALTEGLEPPRPSQQMPVVPFD